MDKRQTKPVYGSTDETFLRKILASVNEAVRTRGEAGVHGELTLKITQVAGVIQSAKILEEAIVKPTD